MKHNKHQNQVRIIGGTHRGRKLGALPATNLRTIVAQILSVIYFAFFLGMPFYTKIDKDRPVPERVTMSTSKQKWMFFVYVAIAFVGAYLFATNI